MNVLSSHKLTAVFTSIQVAKGNIYFTTKQKVIGLIGESRQTYAFPCFLGIHG